MADMLTKLKAASVAERKKRSDVAVFTTFVVAEAVKIGKAKGNRDTTDDEAIQVLKKLRETAVENKNEIEIAWLDSMLPQMASDDEVKAFLNEAFGDGGGRPSKGDIMKALKVKYGSLVDMKRAGAIASEMFP